MLPEGRKRLGSWRTGGLSHLAVEADQLRLPIATIAPRGQRLAHAHPALLARAEAVALLVLAVGFRPTDQLPHRALTVDKHCASENDGPNMKPTLETLLVIRLTKCRCGSRVLAALPLHMRRALRRPPAPLGGKGRVHLCPVRGGRRVLRVVVVPRHLTVLQT